MTNLLKETLAIMSDKGKTPEDVAFIGSGEFGCTWTEFETLADFEYDSGYGGAEVAEDLAVIFHDGSWMERGEYDGSEWWSYRTAPTIPESYRPIRRLTGDSMWEGLAGLNRDAEDEA